MNGADREGMDSVDVRDHHVPDDGRTPPDPSAPTVAMLAGLLAIVPMAGIGVLGLMTVALCCGITIAVLDGAVLWLRRRVVRAVPGDRQRLRRFRPAGSVAMVWVTLIAVPAVAFVQSWLVWGLDSQSLTVDASHRLWPFRGAMIAAFAMPATVHVSSLIDWALIHPRLRGVMGDHGLPCQRTTSTDWQLLTRLWLGHRLVASLVGRVGLAVVVGFLTVLIIPGGPGNNAPAAGPPTPASSTASTTTGGTTTPSATPAPGATTATPAPTTTATTTASPTPAGNAGQTTLNGSTTQTTGSTGTTAQPTATIVGAIGAALLVLFLNRLFPAGALVANPRVSVGDRIVLAEEYGTGVDERPVFYVVDISVQGVKLLQLDEEDQPIRSDGPARRDGISDEAGTEDPLRPGRAHDRSVALQDVPRLLRLRGRFGGCAERCCGANHQCPLKAGDLVDPRVPTGRPGSADRLKALRGRVVRGDRPPAADAARPSAGEGT